jgi:outer membrane protein, multidrug efflux system
MKLSARFSNAKHIKHVVASAIVCSMLLLVLPGCHIIPFLRPPAPGPGPVPESFNGVTSPENSAHLEIEEFYNDPMLIPLIHQALVGNRELKIMNEEVQVARNEVLARSGAYLPFVTGGANASLNRYSRFTLDGASVIDDPYLPGKHFPNPMGMFGTGLNLAWRLDIYRQLRNARDAAALRYIAVADRRNYFVTSLVAEIAENYYKLVALDRRLENLDLIIQLNQNSLQIAQARLAFARGRLLAVQRFESEVRKNQSQKLIVAQDIIQAENRINFLVNRFPQPVKRRTAGIPEFFDLKIHDLSLGVPSQLLLNRPDILEAERDLAAAGLDVRVARVNFFPQLDITGGVGWESFSLRYMFEPTAVAGNIAGGVVGPLFNFRAIQAQYMTANAMQLQSLYNYQRVIVNAFTEVINRMAKVENYARSVEIKKMQVERLVASVETANRLFQNAQTEYIDVLFAQRDLWDARADLIDTKQEQLSAVVSVYQALGGGWLQYHLAQHDPKMPMPHALPPLPQEMPPPPHIAAGPPIPPMPPLAPDDPANPGLQPAGPRMPQPGGANDLPPALPGSS